jgi:5'-nucleotidase
MRTNRWNLVLVMLAANVGVACGSDDVSAPPGPVDSGTDSSDAVVDSGTDSGVDTTVADTADAAPLPKGTADLQILNVSDWHAQCDPISDSGSTYGGTGVLAAYFKNERATNPNTYFMTAGDAFGASPALSGFNDEKPAVESLNFLELKVDTFGNHNFDRGTAFLKTTMDLAKYSWVSTNLKNGATELGTKLVTPSYSFDIGSGDNVVRVAVLGITNPDAPSLVFPGRMGTIVVQEPIAAANAAAKDARAAGANVVIALVHMGVTGKDTAGAATGPLIDFAKGLTADIDVVLGDHTDQVVNTTIGTALVVENRSKGRTYARTTIHVEKGAVTKKEAKIVDPVLVQKATLTCTTPPCTCPTTSCPDTTYTCTAGACVKSMITADPAAETMLKPYRDKLATKFDEKIGKTTDIFKRDGTLERTSEVAIGDLLTDALLDKYKPVGAQIAIMNSGGIRATLPSSYVPKDTTLVRTGCSTTTPCDLVVGDVYTVLPFGNAAVVRKLTGATLWSVLEWSVAKAPSADGRFLQIAGFKYTYKTTTTPRVQSVTLDGGKVITSTDATEYSMVLGDFTNAGGDGYSMLVETTPSPAREILADTLLDFMKAKTAPLTPATAFTRITAL